MLSKSKYIKVFGIERSGTLYAIELINKNLVGTLAFTEEFGDRHKMPLDLYIKTVKKWWLKNRKQDRKLLTSGVVRLVPELASHRNKIYPIVIIKNPYTWYKSIHRYRAQQFIDLDKEYKHFNKLYGVYKELIERKVLTNSIYGRGMAIRYEDLIRDPKFKLKQIAHLINTQSYDDVDVPNKVNGSDAFSKKLKEYYLSKGPWMLSASWLKQIEQRVDWKLMQTYGYRPVKPEDFYDPCLYDGEELVLNLED